VINIAIFFLTEINIAIYLYSNNGTLQIFI